MRAKIVATTAVTMALGVACSSESEDVNLRDDVDARAGAASAGGSGTATGGAMGDAGASAQSGGASSSGDAGGSGGANTDGTGGSCGGPGGAGASAIGGATSAGAATGGAATGGAGAVSSGGSSGPACPAPCILVCQAGICDCVCTGASGAGGESAGGTGSSETGGTGGMETGGTSGAETAGAGGAGGQSAVCTFTIGPGWLWRGQQEATCEVPTNAARPCWEAAVCMCEQGFVDPLGPDEVESCAGSLFEPRGAVTLIDFCRNSPSEPTMSLGEAITEFANDYDTTAATSPDCEEAPAYF